MTINWRYFWWFVWSNMITLLATIQAIVSTLLLNSDIFTKGQFHSLVIANAVLTAIVAQIKRNAPPGPPPEKANDPSTNNRATS